jgi:hypothetical protein
MRALSLFVVIPLLAACDRAEHGSAPALPAAQANAAAELKCSSPVENPCKLYDVSMIDLISNPETFDGKPIRVRGFAHFEFEGNGIYLHREDFEQGLFRNGIWLDTGEKSGPRELSDQYLDVQGTFAAARGGGGHLGMWAGEIRNITKMEPWIPHHGPPSVASPVSGTNVQ